MRCKMEKSEKKKQNKIKKNENFHFHRNTNKSEEKRIVPSEAGAGHASGERKLVRKCQSNLIARRRRFVAVVRKHGMVHLRVAFATYYSFT